MEQVVPASAEIPPNNVDEKSYEPVVVEETAYRPCNKKVEEPKPVEETKPVEVCKKEEPPSPCPLVPLCRNPPEEESSPCPAPEPEPQPEAVPEQAVAPDSATDKPPDECFVCAPCPPCPNGPKPEENLGDGATIFEDCPKEEEVPAEEPVEECEEPAEIVEESKPSKRPCPEPLYPKCKPIEAPCQEIVCPQDD